MRSTLRVSLAVFSSVGALSAPQPASAAPPAIYNLGDFYDGSSVGRAVNASGQVSGYSTNFGSPTAFLYTGTPGIDGVMHDLGMFWGEDINDAGQVVGAHNSQAALYTGAPGSGGAVADLGTLGGSESVGIGVNNIGQVTGYSATTNGDFRAFLYTGAPGSGGVMHDLGTNFGDYSTGVDVNDSGQVAGYSGHGTSTGPFHAFLYTGTPGVDGVMHDLGTLGGSISRGRDINNSGQVSGDSQTANGDFHAFLYTGTPGAGGKMADLGTLGGTQSWGAGINDAGQIVGHSFTANGTAQGPLHAFVYIGTPGLDGRMIDLDAWLDANNPDEGAKWELNFAYGLNNNGLITGVGDYFDGFGGGRDGTNIAFLLDARSLLVPEPSSLALLTLAVPAMMLRRRRRTAGARTAISCYRTANDMTGAIR